MDGADLDARHADHEAVPALWIVHPDQPTALQSPPEQGNGTAGSRDDFNRLCLCAVRPAPWGADIRPGIVRDAQEAVA